MKKLLMILLTLSTSAIYANTDSFLPVDRYNKGVFGITETYARAYARLQGGELEWARNESDVQQFLLQNRIECISNLGKTNCKSYVDGMSNRDSYAVCSSKIEATTVDGDKVNFALIGDSSTSFHPTIPGFITAVVTLGTTDFARESYRRIRNKIDAKLIVKKIKGSLSSYPSCQ